MSFVKKLPQQQRALNIYYSLVLLVGLFGQVSERDNSTKHIHNEVDVHLTNDKVYLTFD